MSSTPPDPTERSLETALRRRPLTPEALERIRGAAEAEWRTLARQKQSRRVWGGIAAALVALAVVAGVWLRPSAEASVVGSVIRGTLSTGAALRTGDTVTVQGPVLIALTVGGTLRVARGTVIKALDAHDIELRGGQLYVDLPTRSPSFTVTTSMGSIEHVGTQFEVMTGAQELRVRVREGEILVRRPAGTETAEAGTELIVPPTGGVARRPLATFGREWAWVEALAPDYDIEDRPLADFLTWAARETGRRLEITDTHARELAERTRLHGSVRGLPPVEALDAALSATSLRFELREDAIRVSSGG